MLETQFQTCIAFYASCHFCLFQFDTLLLGDTSTKVLFRPLACISTLVLYKRDGTGNSLTQPRICHHTS